MSEAKPPPSVPPPARERLLEAAVRLIRVKGFSATTVEELCAAAGVSKGAFFHHFQDKDALGVAAADHWSLTTGAFFAAAPYHAPADPLERVLAYLDFRRALITGEVAEFTCLVGTMLQDVHETSPAIREACEASLTGHAATLEADIGAAMAQHGVGGDWTASSLALHTQAVLQGAFVLAKARGGPQAAIESVDHLRRYVELLFRHPTADSPHP